MEAVVSETVTPEDLMVSFLNLKIIELAKGSVSKDSQFEYAWCLIRSKYSNDIAKGILLLEGETLSLTTFDETYLFYLAVANYRLKEYEKGLKYVRVLLKNEPSNTQGLELEKLIKKAMQKGKQRLTASQYLPYNHLYDVYGLVGMAIVGGIGLGVAGLAGLIGLAVAKSK
ncbi:mitochondrial fission 1 protein [Huso huso]|uniref:Mitochondrial fission 1 protein n=1 Tax=Huso huso TaxID=61971 RepID=A0ABR0YZQ2_HUSHU